VIGSATAHALCLECILSPLRTRRTREEGEEEEEESDEKEKERAKEGKGKWKKEHGSGHTCKAPLISLPTLLYPPSPHPHFHSFEKQTLTKLTQKFCQREKKEKGLALKKKQSRQKGGNFFSFKPLK